MDSPSLGRVFPEQSVLTSPVNGALYSMYRNAIIMLCKHRSNFFDRRRSSAACFSHVSLMEASPAQQPSPHLRLRKSHTALPRAIYKTCDDLPQRLSKVRRQPRVSLLGASVAVEEAHSLTAVIPLLWARIAALTLRAAHRCHILRELPILPASVTRSLL